MYMYNEQRAQRARNRATVRVWHSLFIKNDALDFSRNRKKKKIVAVFSFRVVKDWPIP